MALVELSVVEQRYRAVLAVLAGATEVAARLGVSRQAVSGWKSRYEASGLAGLVDRSRRPVASRWMGVPVSACWPQLTVWHGMASHEPTFLAVFGKRCRRWTYGLVT